MAATTAEHVLAVAAVGIGAAIVAPVAVPALLAAGGATALAASLGAYTGISLTAGGAGLSAGWLTHKWLNATGKASN